MDLIQCGTCGEQHLGLWNFFFHKAQHVRTELTVSCILCKQNLSEDAMGFHLRSFHKIIELDSSSPLESDEATMAILEIPCSGDVEEEIDSDNSEFIDGLEENGLDVIQQNEVEVMTTSRRYRKSDDEQKFMVIVDVDDEKMRELKTKLDSQRRWRAPGGRKRDDDAHFFNRGNKQPKRYQCDQCPKGYNKRLYLQQHKDNHHTAGRIYKCLTCDDEFLNKRALSLHSRKHKNDSWKCSICDFQTYKTADIFGHRQIHPDKNSVKCQVCGLYLLQKEKLCDHMNKHLNFQDIECSTLGCQVRCISIFQMRQHVNIAHGHTDVGSVNCELCQCVIKRNSVTRHMKCEHKYPCPAECGLTFISQADSKKHGQTHGVSCDVCKAVMYKDELNDHLFNYHPEEYDSQLQKNITVENQTNRLNDAFACSFPACDMKFVSKDVLDAHTDMVHGLPCSVCNKVISKKGLDGHMRGCHRAEWEIQQQELKKWKKVKTERVMN